jgi:hypothetical protein
VTHEDYVRSVGFWLRDLPWRTRRDLKTELRGHLDELPADTDLAERLGTPQEYATDLRSAAGLERRRGPIAFLRARRPRNLAAVALALIAAGLAIGSVVWIASYQPIAFAGGTQFPLDAKPSSGRAGETVVFRKGRPFQFGIVIRNAGRFTVRVIGVPKGVLDFYSGHLLMSEDQSGGMNERPLEGFRPFDMKPGSFRWLVFKGVFACTTGMGGPDPGYGAVTREGFPVRFRFLWRTATASIPLNEPLEIDFSKEGCPPKR